MAKSQQVQIIPLSRIEPDPLQPRRTFNPSRLAELMKSIKKHGIMNPLVIEPLPSGKFILIDGERRYRASVALKMKEVPAIITEGLSEMERLIRQFHLQEQHEGWSPLEKAVALNRLAQETGMTMLELAESLSLPKRTVDDYMAYASLVAKREFEKSEISVSWARTILSTKRQIKKVYMEVLEEEFTKEMEKAFELAVIARIKSGDLQQPRDLIKLKDVVVAEPKYVEKFIKNQGTSLDKLYLESKAKSAYLARNLKATSGYMHMYITQGMPLGLVTLIESDEGAVRTLKRTYKTLGEFINKLG